MQWKKRLNVRISVFAQLIATYLLVVLFIMAVLSPVLSKAIEQSKRSYLTDAQYALDSSSTVLQNTFKEIYQLPIKLDDYNYYVKLKSNHGGNGEWPLDMTGSLFLSHKTLMKQLATLEYVDEIFVYLGNNDVMLGKQRVFMHAQDYLQFDLVYESHTADQVLAWLRTKDRTARIFPAAKASVHNGPTQQYLLAAFTRPTDSAVVGALLSQKNLLELFGIKKLPPDSFLYITDAQGKLQYTYQYGGDPLAKNTREAAVSGHQYSVLSTGIPLPMLTVTLGIPEGYFAMLQQPLTTLVRGLQIAAALLGVVLSMLFAAINYLPVRKLVRVFKQNISGMVPSHIREYDVIAHYMATSSKTISELNKNIEKMENTLQANLLLRLLYGTISPLDSDAASRLLPQTEHPYRIAIFHLETDAQQPENDYIGYYIFQQLDLKLKGEFVLGQLSPYRTAALLADTPANMEALQEVHRALNQHEPLVSCGVSEAVTGKKYTGIAFHHAQFAVSVGQEGALTVYDVAHAPSPEPPVGFYGMQRLYEYMMACDKEKTRELLERIYRSLSHGDGQTAQVFYLVRFVLESVARDSGLPLKQPLPEYVKALTDQELFDLLIKDADMLVHALQEKRLGRQSAWRDTICIYVEQHFTDTDLYADTIAEACGVSRNQVYKAIREQTGSSLNEHIERLRMKKAMELLKGTDQTVAQISQECGYSMPNTFYKVFKKHFGFAPGSVRG